MPFTSSLLIKKHLLTSTFPQLVIRNVPVTLTKMDPVELPHHNLVSESDVVKWDIHVAPVADHSVTLKGESFQNLEHAQLVPGTVLVTLSEAFSTIFVEEADYQIDYVAGQIRRLAAGAIPDQQLVLVYYSFYALFERDTDYVMDSANGILARLDSGAIPDGATVLLDYMVASGTVEDDLIAEAITEAEDIILRFLAPEYNASSTDQGLKTGATELALSIICRAQAIEALSRRTTTDIPGRAKEWQQLSRVYEQQAWHTLAPFLLPMSLRSITRQPREE